MQLADRYSLDHDPRRQSSSGAAGRLNRNPIGALPGRTPDPLLTNSARIDQGRASRAAGLSTPGRLGAATFRLTTRGHHADEAQKRPDVAALSLGPIHPRYRVGVQRAFGVAEAMGSAQPLGFERVTSQGYDRAMIRCRPSKRWFVRRSTMRQAVARC
jgi:hypothetical protein